MIFSLVDRKPITLTPERTLPTHFYLVISTGSEACLQDIQCMSISSMSGKSLTYELPIIIQDTVSYVLPYNIASFRKEDIKMEFYRGLLVGNRDVMETSDFLQLCRDIYTDALYGEIEASLKTRISDYQKRFESAFGHVPKYEKKSFKNCPMSSRADDFNTTDATIDFNDASTFKTSLAQVDALPRSYAAWTDKDIFTALLFWGNNDMLQIVSQSNRFKSLGTLKNVQRQMRQRVREMRNPLYTTVIEGHEYSFNFITSKCISDTSDGEPIKAMTARINRAMKG